MSVKMVLTNSVFATFFLLFMLAHFLDLAVCISSGSLTFKNFHTNIVTVVYHDQQVGVY